MAASRVGKRSGERDARDPGFPQSANAPRDSRRGLPGSLPRNGSTVPNSPLATPKYVVAYRRAERSGLPAASSRAPYPATVTNLMASLERGQRLDGERDGSGQAERLSLAASRGFRTSPAGDDRTTESGSPTRRTISAVSNIRSPSERSTAGRSRRACTEPITAVHRRTTVAKLGDVVGILTMPRLSRPWPWIAPNVGRSLPPSS